MNMLRSLSHDTKKVRYACVYLVLSATDQAKAVAELIQHVHETTLEAVEQDVGETTVNLLVYIVCLFCIVSNHSFRW